MTLDPPEGPGADGPAGLMDRGLPVARPWSPLLLPPRARLLHVGLMKTGTTALQQAASRRRRVLLRHGVRYPGHRYNHRQAALALLRRRGGRGRSERPDDWDELLAEVAAERQRRI